MTLVGSIARWSLRRPRLIAWTCLWFVLCAGLYLRDMRVDLLPNLAPAETAIQTEAPGLDAEQVEQTVTRPIESALLGAPGVAKVSSQSIQDLSSVTVQFAPGGDPYRIRQAVAENLARVGGLPPGVASPRIAPLRAAGAQVLTLGFTSDRLDPMALRDLVQWTVRPRLLSVAGVGRVTLHGGQTRRIEIHARPADLSDSDLGFLDILAAARRATGVAGAGFIDTPNQRVLIEPHGQALTPDDVGAGQIQTPGGAPVRINDVADVVWAAAPQFGDALIDGKPGVVLSIEHQFGANTPRTTQAVEAALALLRPALAAQGVQVRDDLDRPADFVAQAMGGIGLDLAIGAFLVAAALALFMRNPRATLVCLVSVPLALLAALIALKALGLTLNAMTLGGLAVALGLVIDDALIDVENILARLNDAQARHASRREALVAAAIQVRAPLIYATAAVVISVTPLLMLSPGAGDLMAPLGVAIIVGAIASLVVALTVTPALAWLFLGEGGAEAQTGAPGALRNRHAAWLERATARPWPILATAAGGALFIGLIGLLALRPTFLPSLRDRQILVESAAPISTAPLAIQATGRRLAHDLLAVPGVRSVTQIIGRDDSGDEGGALERSTFDLALAPSLGGAAQETAARRVRAVFDTYPGLRPQVRSRFDATQAGAVQAAPFQVQLFGPDLDALDAAAARITAALAPLPGAGVVMSPNNGRAPVVRIDLNFQRLALFGLSAADALDTVQAAFAGERVAQIYDGARVVDLAVSAQDDLRQDPERIGALLLRSTSGVSVPLSSVANVYLTDGRSRITHENGLRTREVLANPAPADAPRFARAAKAAIARLGPLPPGVFLEFAAGRPSPTGHGGLTARYLLTIFAVFALLTLAFDGRTAGLILGSTLFAFAGGALAVLLLGRTLSVGATIGFIALAGLSMRSSILLLSRAEDLALDRQTTWSPALLIRAVQERAWPVIITACLVALALAPFALQADAAGREILGPMAWVILGGLLTGTLANLTVLPVMIFAFWRPGYHRLAHPTTAHAEP